MLPTGAARNIPEQAGIVEVGIRGCAAAARRSDLTRTGLGSQAAGGFLPTVCRGRVSVAHRPLGQPKPDHPRGFAARIAGGVIEVDGEVIRRRQGSGRRRPASWRRAGCRRSRTRRPSSTTGRAGVTGPNGRKGPGAGAGRVAGHGGRLPADGTMRGATISRIGEEERRIDVEPIEWPDSEPAPA